MCSRQLLQNDLLCGKTASGHLPEHKKLGFLGRPWAKWGLACKVWPSQVLRVAEGAATDQRQQQQVPTTLNSRQVGALVRRSQRRARQAKKLLLCWPCTWRSPIDRGRDNLIDQGVRLLQHLHVNLRAAAPEDDLCVSVDAHLDLLCDLPNLRRAQRLLRTV